MSHKELITEARNYPYVDYGILINDLADALEAAERERDEANERWAGQISECSGHIRTANEYFEERHRQLVAYNDELRQAVEQAGREYTVRGEILIAAIERAEHAERERDEAVARGDRYHNLIQVWEGESSLSTCDWGGCSREAMGFRSCREHDEVHDQLPVCDQHTEAYEALQRERDEAVADNAALLEALNDAVAEYADATRFDKHGDEAEIARLRGIAEADHPGAALLARIERLEAVLQSTRGLLNEMHLPTQGCTAEACTMRTDFCCVRQSVIDALSESEATG